MNEEIQKLAMVTPLDVQQREDIRRDLAERMKFVPPDLRPGEMPSTGKKTRAKFSKGAIQEMVEGRGHNRQRSHGYHQ